MQRGTLLTLSVTGGLAIVLVVAIQAVAYAHCQIPCGIYGDELRFSLLREDIDTVEKSMNQVVELSQHPEKNANQVVRWVTNKDTHADRIAETITAYFLQQRVKPVSEEDGKAYRKYVEQLELCHAILVSSMKAKQTTDLEHVEDMRKALDKFEAVYFGKEEPAADMKGEGTGTKKETGHQNHSH